MGSCHYCKNAISAEVLLRHRLCPQCGSDLHCCQNCVHFAPGTASGCREPESPWVGDRSTQNDCGYFEFRRTADAVPVDTDERTQAEQAKRAFAALFRPGPSRES